VLFNGNLEEPNYIKILWNERGVIFETFGNACDVAIEGNDFDLTEYGGHNIDNSKQALVLYGCLSIYMKHIMEHLDFCERNPEVYSGWPDVEEGVVSLISFNKKGLAKLARR
jgi:hypothetical protein